MLLVDCLKDSINEVAYQAEQASLTAQVSYEGPEGFQISVSGFNDKLQTLACSLAKVRVPLRTALVVAACRSWLLLPT